MEGAPTGTGGKFQPGQQLRPLGVGEVLDAAVKLYTRNAAKLWKIVAVLLVPVALLNQIVVGVSLPSGAFVSDGTLYTPSGTLGTPAGATITQIVLSVLAALIVQGALALCLVDAYIGQSLDWRAALRAAATRIGSLVWLSILYGVLVVLGFIAVVLPGIWLVVIWSVAVPALMFEHVGGFKALGRSFDLVRGRWWATFAEELVAVIMLVVVLAVVALLFRGIESGLKVGSIGLWLGINWLANVIAELIALPFFAAVIAVVYIDLRVRKEALDLELLAGALGRATEHRRQSSRPSVASPDDLRRSARRRRTPPGHRLDESRSRRRDRGGRLPGDRLRLGDASLRSDLQHHPGAASHAGRPTRPAAMTSALAELRSVTAVDGRPAGLGLVLGSADGSRLRARLLALSLAGPSLAVSADGARRTAAATWGRPGTARRPFPIPYSARCANSGGGSHRRPPALRAGRSRSGP